MPLITEPLRMELHFEIYGASLSDHPFFASYMAECRQAMRRICHNAMSMLHFAPGDVVFNAGETPATPRMYFACQSSLDYRPVGGLALEVGKNAWVAEAAL